MIVGVTGATGALGESLLRRFPGALPIKRKMPDEPVDLLIHAATPTWWDRNAVEAFVRFNHSVRRYVDRHSPAMINVGSWWQYAGGTVAQEPHTLLKQDQQDLFPEARHVVAYSIFGPRKGFARDIARHVTGQMRMASLTDEWRDFIHVDDVADAVAWATCLVPGVYAACSGEPVRVSTAARSFGINLPRASLGPTAELSYPLENIAATTVHMAEFAAHLIAVHAEKAWAQQSREWKAA